MDSLSVHNRGLTETEACNKKPAFDKKSSFTPIEKIINLRASRNPEFPQQEILLVRLCMHMQNKILEHCNKILLEEGINETLFMALITLDSQESRSIQPSELSEFLGSSRTNATRIADKLEKRGWIERCKIDSDRRCLHLHITDEGKAFLDRLLPPQHQSLHFLWSALEKNEQKQLEFLMRKLLVRLDERDTKNPRSAA
ncbi:MAG: transcriptional repressor MprA [Candidatus Malihini olakiniferum]